MFNGESVNAPKEDAHQETADPFIYRVVVITLAVTVLLTISGMIGLIILGRTIPEAFVAFGSAAIGTLGGLLVPPLRHTSP